MCVYVCVFTFEFERAWRGVQSRWKVDRVSASGVKVGAEIVFCFLCVCLFFITTMDSGKDGVFRG